jgi:hypothetical protein
VRAAESDMNEVDIELDFLLSPTTSGIHMGVVEIKGDASQPKHIQLLHYFYNYPVSNIFA